jgi:acetyltransferase-like isoleucine patch superfamily enzyme
MNSFLFDIYRAIRFVFSKMNIILTNGLTKILFYVNNIDIATGFKANGVPMLHKHHTGKFTIGKNFKINNTIMNNPIGRSEKCMFVVREDATLSIGNNVGISGVTIVCQKNITIEDNVKIGGNVCIYDTDFHSLNAQDRNHSIDDKRNTIKKNVVIGENSFIGAHSTILKGVTVGKNSIIGACSVVTKDVPENEIWAGNPARFIRTVDGN